MKTNIFLLVFMLVLPSQLTGITTTHHDKTEKTMPDAEEELAPASTSRINITERQRRLIPYMTFYLTRNLNRPSQQLQELREPPAQQYQVIPQKVTIQPYHGKIILVNNQPKYNDQPAILYQQKIPYTPFLESNKLPGGFTPMRNPPHSQQPIRVQVINPNVQNNPPPASTKEPNFSFIFDKLLQLKQLQYNKPPQYTQMQPPERPKVTAQYFTRNYATPRPPTKFITVENYPPEPEVSYKPPPIKTVPTKYVTIENYPPEIQYKPPPPVKTAPKFIAIENIQPETNYKQQIPVKPAPTKYITLEEVNYKTAAPVKPTPTKFITVENYPPENIQPETRYKTPAPTKTYIHTYTPSNIDISNDNKIQNYENFESLKTYNQIPSPVPTKQQEYEPTPITVNIQNVPQYTKEPEYEQPNTQINDEKNYEPIIVRPLYRPNLVPVKNYAPIYQQQQSATVAPPQSYAPTENPHSLSVILKQLQDSNTLPQTLTPDNIDNSIKTLVHILNALKHTQKFQRPIVVAPSEDSSQQEENIDEYDEDVLPETVSHSFPAETPEGGTPGKPGIDYPAYSFIPQTNFNCKKQRYKGFFGDPDTNCQVWHYCDLNGGQASFLCPNGTIFSQVALTCDWWYNVKCATTTQLYVLNERLYKYILPFTPKFPEDYSGPLVDRYLALKFKEMEEKMKKQKKGKTEKATDEEPNSEVNNLQDIEDDHNEAVAESKKQEQTTHISEEEDKKSK